VAQLSTLGIIRASSMKLPKFMFVGLMFTILALLVLLVLYWQPWKPNGELTDRELITLTNAMRVATAKPIIGIQFSDSDNEAFVWTGYFTNYDTTGPTNRATAVDKVGYIFERRLFGWKFIKGP
jgi:hypothetical protein